MTSPNSVLTHLQIAPIVFNFFDNKTHLSALQVCKQWGPWVIAIVKKQKLFFLTELCRKTLDTQPVIQPFTALNLRDIDHEFSEKIQQIFHECQPLTLQTSKPRFLNYTSTYNKNEEVFASLEKIFQVGSLNSVIGYINSAFNEDIREKLYLKYFSLFLEKPLNHRNQGFYFLIKHSNLVNNPLFVQCVLKILEKLFEDNQFEEINWALADNIEPTLKKVIIKNCVNNFIKINFFQRAFDLIVAKNYLFDSTERNEMFYNFINKVVNGENVIEIEISQAFNLIDLCSDENLKMQFCKKLSEKSELIQRREFYKNLNARYEREVSELIRLFEKEQIEQAFQYYQKHLENPTLHLAIPIHIISLFSKEKFAQIEKIINGITEPFIKKQAQAVYDCISIKEMLNDISETLHRSSFEECQEIEKNIMGFQLPPSCLFLLKGLIFSRYITLDSAIEKVEKLVKENPGNYFISSSLASHIASFCKEKEIEKAQVLYLLLTEEKECKLAQFYIDLAKSTL
jgi:hypothetical protein